MVDADPIREHLRKLYDAGVGWTTVATNTGIDRRIIRRIVLGRRCKGSTERALPPLIQAKTARAILAVPVPIEPDLWAIDVRQKILAAQAGRKLKPRKERQLRFPEWYGELRDLGYDDFEIMRRRGMTADALVRQMERYGLPVSDVLNAELRLAKAKRKRAA
jgi:hypothetical protein